MKPVLRLSEILGCRVHVDDAAGRLIDLAADPAQEQPPITRLRVRLGRGRERDFLWGDVEHFEPGEVVLRSGAGQTAGERQLLYLAQHVLDLQIVDLVGKRASRVGEVLLEREGSSLRLEAVEVGAAPVLRRLGLRALAGRLGLSVIGWRDLHPASGRAHAIQLGSRATRVHAMSADQLAVLLGTLPATRGAEVLRAVEPRRAGDALAVAKTEEAARAAAALTARERAELMQHLPASTRARLGRRPTRGSARRYRRVLAARRRAPS